MSDRYVHFDPLTELQKQFEELQDRFKQTTEQMAAMMAQGFSRVEDANNQHRLDIMDAIVQDKIASSVIDDTEPHSQSSAFDVHFRWRNDTDSGNEAGIHRLEYIKGDRYAPGGGEWPDANWNAVDGADGVPCGS